MSRQRGLVNLLVMTLTLGLASLGYRQDRTQAACDSNAACRFSSSDWTSPGRKALHRMENSVQ